MNNEQQLDSMQLNGRDALGLAELIYGVLFNPVQTFRRISDNPPLLKGFLIFFVVVLLTSLTGILVPPGFSYSAEINTVWALTGPVIGIIGAFFAIIGWFVEAGLLQLLAEFLGGRGKAVGVLTVLALARIPRVFVIPFQVISYFLAGSLAARFLVIAVSVTVFVWWVVLLVIGLREIQGFSTARALATLLIPLCFLGLTIVIFSLALVGFIVPLMNRAFPSL